MATLSAWKFSTVHGADAAEYTIRELEANGKLALLDAIMVTWEFEARRPTTRHMKHPEAHGALGGSFWGLLIGLLFFVPLLGAAVGAAVGGLRGSLRDVGIDDTFIEEVRREVVPGTSAIFLLTENAVVADVAEAFEGQDLHLVSTNLSAEQERALRRAFGDDDANDDSAAGDG